MGPRRNVQDNASIHGKRLKLLESIDEFWRSSSLYLPPTYRDFLAPPDVSDEWVSLENPPTDDDDPPSFDDDDDAESDADEPALDRSAVQEEMVLMDNALPAEEQRLPLPSTFGPAACAGRLKQLAEVELSLRKGQANDALHALRLAIGQKSFVYWNKIRKGSTGVRSNYRRRKRNSADAGTLELSIDQSSKVYASARRAMTSLGASEADLEKYKKLLKDHVSANTAVVDFNAPGQRNKSLPWIWHVNHSPAEDPMWMQERKVFTSQRIAY